MTCATGQQVAPGVGTVVHGPAYRIPDRGDPLPFVDEQRLGKPGHQFRIRPGHSPVLFKIQAQLVAGPTGGGCVFPTPLGPSNVTAATYGMKASSS